MSIPETEGRVRVGLEGRSYDILIGPGLLDEAGRHMIAAIGAKRRLVVVTDGNVKTAGHLARLETALAASGLVQLASPIVLPTGEATKDFRWLKWLVDGLLDAGIDRKSVLVALGGGVIGDITGFAAAIALRGIDFIQVPTTLLAQVDSSVGGKTGINSGHGKNLIGAFHQPRLVLADTGVLSTLEARERRSGYAEVLKYALIGDPGFFEWLEANGAAVIEGEPAAVRQAVAVSCQAKATIVGADEREAGQRALLNLGHTFGHALEAACEFDDRLRHGEAVGLGMALAFDLSARLGLCPPGDAERVRAHLRAVGLPASRAEVPAVPWVPRELLVHMSHDKKASEGRITFVLARGIGQAFLTAEVVAADVLAVLEG